MPTSSSDKADAGLGALPPAAQALIKAARAGKPKPVSLVYGEPSLVSVVAEAFVDALVPAAKRSVNLEVYDGRATPLVSVLDSLRMGGLFAGAKLVWVRELPMLVAGEKRADIVAAILKGVADARMESAAGRFLSLAAAAGWSQEEFDEKRLSEMSKKAQSQAFGEDLSADDVTALENLQEWMRSRGMKVAAGADASEELLAVLEKGLSPGVTLLLTGSSVDSRKRVVKRLREVGEVVELGVERERTGALTAESAAAVIDRVLASHGKKLAPPAREALMRRVGGDPGALANEVEKLCLFAAEAPLIGRDHVEAVVRDLAGAWIFDFTEALAKRETARAMLLLRALLRAGDHPLRLLATLHSHVRLLLVLRECLDGPWKGKWKPGTRTEAFANLVELLDEAEKPMLKGMHPYRLSLNTGYAARMKRETLRAAVAQLADLDTRFKSSRGDPAMLLETFVMDLCK
jgi:DNA polymerase III delta subunit